MAILHWKQGSLCAKNVIFSFVQELQNIDPQFVGLPCIRFVCRHEIDERGSQKMDKLLAQPSFPWLIEFAFIYIRHRLPIWAMPPKSYIFCYGE